MGVVFNALSLKYFSGSWHLCDGEQKCTRLGMRTGKVCLSHSVETT